ncbi:MAG: hypothetical protein AAGF95_23445 [Chloroflexota bacterium]
MLDVSRKTVRIGHAASGMLAILLITAFLVTTVIVELSGNTPLITHVKQGIAYGVVVLIPTMIAIGLTGRRLAGTSQAPLIVRKRRQMVIIAVNGLFILVPCALVLAWLATMGSFGFTFALLQGIELIAGGINLTLLVLTAKLGRQMTLRHRGKAV